ncbi:NAD-dependent 4,6-dehydratase LegB [Aestuariibacter halophilus]|uniref:NAD-dependent 4,6-dehydratase LegB n=1 Tax=Fluctibacter halophilus TaxID=226011 RepID=A0ABS8G7B6_9ALTE|nr:NAD-dependent 4,6-dehydratase LegB [Aestuariibacter halophilus]MCC2615121.1 NAD-dependent 4,6-dehydratase LegB [Aestuariibacter halophilus]
MAKVLVTGADGFIGSHLVEMLVKKGHQVKALVQYNSFNHLGWLDSSPVLSHIDVVSGDIRDAAFCHNLVQGCETVYHLAALIAIPYSYAAPQSYIDTNVNGTLNMCQAALAADVSRFIQTSTSEVYGTARYVPIDEAHPLQPQSPYSASKIGADAIAQSFWHTFELPLTVARPFNTYGPRQSARAVIPTVITQIASGLPTLRLGDVSPTRDFNYVEDTCAGLMALAEHNVALGEAVNIGSNYEISIGDTVALIKSLMNSDIVIETDEQRMRPSGSEVFRLWADNSKLSSLTGFSPSHSLSDGLEKTIAWFTQQDNLKKYKPGEYNV